MGVQITCCLFLRCPVFFWLCLCYFCLVQSIFLSRTSMKGKVMAPFRAPREGEGSKQDKTKEFVRRKDNSRHFKEMEKWTDKHLTGVQIRRKGWKKTVKTRDKGPDSEEATELGLVWERQKVSVEDDDAPNPWWPNGSPSRATMNVINPVKLPSPHPSEFEALLDDMEKRPSKSCQNKNVVAVDDTGSDNDDDHIPFATIAKQRRQICEGKECNHSMALAALKAGPTRIFVPETQDQSLEEKAISDTEDDLLPPSRTYSRPILRRKSD
jgi:hypothetical protein